MLGTDSSPYIFVTLPSIKQWLRVYTSLNFYRLNWSGLEFTPQWSRVRVFLGQLEPYMIVNFKAHEISRGTRKLVQISTLIKKKEREEDKRDFSCAWHHLVIGWDCCNISDLVSEGFGGKWLI